MAYNRKNAVAYAQQWAFKRNPRYLNFSGLGGDCTSFISQCLLAGGAPMNYTKTMGWYYNSANDRAPAWSSVKYLYQFLINNKGIGPKGTLVPIEEVEIGDVIQLSFDGYIYSHTLLVVKTGEVPDAHNVLIATHTDDSYNRPLDTYEFAKKYRCLKIRVD